MKKQYIIFLVSVILFAIVAGITGCGGGGNTGISPVSNPTSPSSNTPTTGEDTPTPVPSPLTITLDQLQILEDQVVPIADSALFASSNEPNAFYNAANQIKNIQGVKAVVTNEHSLSVEYDFGGIHTWVNNPPILSVPNLKFIKSSVKNSFSSSDLVENKKAVIINALYDDDGYGVFKNEVHPTIGTLLNNLGYEVHYLNGAEASIEALKSLNNYGIIVFLGHGSAAGFFKSFTVFGSWSTSMTIIQTGELVPDKEFLEDLWGDLSYQFSQQYIVKTTFPWGEKRTENKCFWSITQRFFENYYKDHNFSNNSIFFNGACESMKPSTLGKSPMAQALENLGIGIYLGWSDINTIGTFSAAGLFDEMKYGDTLSNAFNDLDPRFKVSHYKEDPNNPNSKEIIAYLQYYPDNNTTRNIQLINLAEQKYYSWEIVESNGEFSIPQMATVDVYAKFKNIGNVAWNPNIIYLGTDHPQNRNCEFYTPSDLSWLNKTRIKMDNTSLVQPGEVATFTFTITTNSVSGTYTEYFRLVADREYEGLPAQWFNDLGYNLQIEVQADPNTGNWTVTVD